MPFRGKSFRGKVSVIQGGAGVTPYASIAELVAASEAGLTPGYYEVVGEWIAYWDGAVFAPEYGALTPSGNSYSPFLPASGERVIIGALTGATTSGLACVANEQRISPWLASQDVTVDLADVFVTAVGGGGTANIVIFNADANGRPTTLHAQSSPIAIDGTGTKSAALSTTLTGGVMYWIGIWTSSTPSIRVTAATYAAHVGFDVSGASPAPQYTLIRTVAHGGASTDWVYSAAQTSTRLPLVASMRVA